MKAFVTILILLSTSWLMWQCSTAETSSKESHWDAYGMAMSHGDVITAITAVNAIYASDTADQMALDTLMRLYFIRGNHLSAYQSGKKLRKQSTIHKNILAEAAINLGKGEEAMALYEEIDREDSLGLTLNARYKLATLYFNQEDYPKALDALGQIVTDPQSMELKTRIAGDNAVSQQVVLYAASHNFAGYVFLMMNEFDTAEDHFSEALRIQPDFVLASNNMNQLAEKRASAQ